MGKSTGLRLALPSQVPAGYWDQCPECAAAVFMPVAGSRDSKAPVECPHCASAIPPEC